MMIIAVMNKAHKIQVSAFLTRMTHLCAYYGAMSTKTLVNMKLYYKTYVKSSIVIIL